MSDFLHPDETQPMSDQRRAFLEYKRRVGEHGKPFFPDGVWHDVIAAALMMAIILGLSVVWFAQANCDSWWNVSCDRVSTPLEQEHFTPDDPGTVVRNEKGEPVEGEVDHPLLGLLYEDKADPATTSYHPRPEWYFYFLFYLLIIFSNPQLVVFGTILVPTLWLVMLLAWPFVDRRKERRPSRRPVAMAAMVLTAITLLSFSYLGSQSGKESGGPEGITEEQMELPGYAVLFENGAFETCQSCHQLGGVGNGGPGPNLDEVGTRYETADELTDVMANGIAPGMPARGGAPLTDEEVAQVAAFLATLGTPERVAELGSYGQADYDRVIGGGEEADTAPGDQADGEAANTDDLGDEGGGAADSGDVEPVDAEPVDVKVE